MAEDNVADRTGVLTFLERLEAHPDEVDGAGAELVAAAVMWYRTRLDAEARHEQP